MDIVKLYKSGKSGPEIANILGVSSSTIYNLLKKKGVKRNKSRTMILKFQHKKHWSYKGGCINKLGYRILWDKKGKKPIKEHRYVLEKHLGRKLKFNEMVHHINNNRSDNRVENLEIVSYQSHKDRHKFNGTKICETCHKQFSKPPKSSIKLWLKRRFCSKKCRAVTQRKNKAGRFT